MLWMPAVLNPHQRKRRRRLNDTDLVATAMVVEKTLSY